jgi:NADH-quinone oxidoreductase subunit J
MLFSLAAILFALYAVLSNHLVRAIFAVFGTFFCIAAALVFAHADFVGIAHLMVYVGGIIVVMVFAIMLSNPNMLLRLENNTGTLRFTRLIAGLAMLMLLAMLLKFGAGVFVEKELQGNTSVRTLALMILSQYGIIMEVIAIMLLLVLMAVNLVQGKKEEGHA